MIRRLTCPICDHVLPVDVDGETSIFPFCSQRCKMVDLNHWLSGDYIVREELTPDQIDEALAREELPPDEIY